MTWRTNHLRWSVPLGTQQMMGIRLDMFRAGLRHKAPVEGTQDHKILMYVMGHSPGQSRDSWRRQFYNDSARLPPRPAVAPGLASRPALFRPSSRVCASYRKPRPGCLGRLARRPVSHGMKIVDLYSFRSNWGTTENYIDEVEANSQA